MTPSFTIPNDEPAPYPNPTLVGEENKYMRQCAADGCGVWFGPVRPGLPECCPGHNERSDLRNRTSPKRSRVQEMAEAWIKNGKIMHADVIMTETIRAVCEYLRTGPGARTDIERHFLEPL